jgi:HD superfamily phosphodiesterase
MDFAGIKVPDTALVRDAMDLSRSLLEPFLFNHVMRSWLFGIVLAESAAIAPDAELLAVAAILHDLGLTERYNGENRFEVDGANAAREFLERTRHLGSADAACVGRYCTSHDPNTRSP